MTVKNHFQSIFRRIPETVVDKKNVYILDDDKAWKQLSGPLFIRDMPIELQDENGSHLLYGKLLSYSLYELTIERIPGSLGLPIIKEGKTVTVKGFNRDMEPVNMYATISFSSMVSCRLRDLDPIQHVNRRGDVRMPLLGAPAQLFRLNDEDLHDPWECNIINISPNGACVESEWCVPDNLDMRLRAELIKNHGYLSFPCRIVRAIYRDDGKFEYGLLFAQLERRKRNDLLKDIEYAQRVIRCKMNN